MELCYIDESYNARLFALSMLIVPDHTWADCFGIVKDFRKRLKVSDGIFTTKEFHATDFVAGRGRISPQVVAKHRRCEIFREVLEMVADLPGVAIMNGCWPQAGLDDVHMIALDRVLNRLQVRCAAKDDRAILFIDAGRESEIRKIARKMHVFNRIPSQFGAWQSGQPTKNITVDRILEDPIFKDSRRSYFLQIADFIAFALLKSESPPTPHVQRYGLATAFDLVAPVCVREAHRRDPKGLGIIRV